MRVVAPAVVEELLELVTADVAEDAAVRLAVEEPGGPAGARHAVRARAQHLHDPADGPVCDELPGEHGALHVQPLAEVDHVLPAGCARLGARLRELVEGGDRRLVGEVVLAVLHHPQAEPAAVRGDGGTRDQLHPLVGQHGLFAWRRPRHPGSAGRVRPTFAGSGS